MSNKPRPSKQEKAAQERAEFMRQFEEVADILCRCDCTATFTFLGEVLIVQQPHHPLCYLVRQS